MTNTGADTDLNAQTHKEDLTQTYRQYKYKCTNSQRRSDTDLQTIVLSMHKLTKKIRHRPTDNIINAQTHKEDQTQMIYRQ